MKRFAIGLCLLLLGVSQAWAASCSVTEFDVLPLDANNRVIQVPLLYSFDRVGDKTQIDATITVAENLGAEFAVTTGYVWVNCDEEVHVLVGLDPASDLTTGTGMRIPANGFWVALFKGDVSLGTLLMALCDADCS